MNICDPSSESVCAVERASERIRGNARFCNHGMGLIDPRLSFGGIRGLAPNVMDVSGSGSGSGLLGWSPLSAVADQARSGSATCVRPSSLQATGQQLARRWMYVQKCASRIRWEVSCALEMQRSLDR
jgi:hypothetical protein